MRERPAAVVTNVLRISDSHAAGCFHRALFAEPMPREATQDSWRTLLVVRADERPDDGHQSSNLDAHEPGEVPIDFLVEGNKSAVYLLEALVDLLEAAVRVAAQFRHLASELSSKHTHFGSELASEPAHLGSELSSEPAHLGSDPTDLSSELGSEPGHLGPELSSEPDHLGSNRAYLGSELGPERAHLGSEPDSKR